MEAEEEDDGTESRDGEEQSREPAGVSSLHAPATGFGKRNFLPKQKEQPNVIGSLSVSSEKQSEEVQQSAQEDWLDCDVTVAPNVSRSDVRLPQQIVSNKSELLSCLVRIFCSSSERTDLETRCGGGDEAEKVFECLHAAFEDDQRSHIRSVVIVLRHQILAAAETACLLEENLKANSITCLREGRMEENQHSPSFALPPSSFSSSSVSRSASSGPTEDARRRAVFGSALEDSAGSAMFSTPRPCSSQQLCHDAVVSLRRVTQINRAIEVLLSKGRLLQFSLPSISPSASALVSSAEYLSTMKSTLAESASSDGSTNSESSLLFWSGLCDKLYSELFLAHRCMEFSNQWLEATIKSYLRKCSSASSSRPVPPAPLAPSAADTKGDPASTNNQSCPQRSLRTLRSSERDDCQISTASVGSSSSSLLSKSSCSFRSSSSSCPTSSPSSAYYSGCSRSLLYLSSAMERKRSAQPDISAGSCPASESTKKRQKMRRPSGPSSPAASVSLPSNNSVSRSSGVSSVSSSAASLTVSRVILQLFRCGFLRRESASTTSFAVPNLGAFTKWLSAGRAAVLQRIQRTKFREMLKADLYAKPFLRRSPLGMPFHELDLIGTRTLAQIWTPSGVLLRAAPPAEDNGAAFSSSSRSARGLNTGRRGGRLHASFGGLRATVERRRY